MTDNVYISQLTISTRAHLVRGILIFLNISDRYVPRGRKSFPLTSFLPRLSFMRHDTRNCHIKGSRHMHFFPLHLLKYEFPHNEDEAKSLVDCMPPRAKYCSENYGNRMAPLLQYSKEDAVNRRPVALSRKTSEFFSSELVNCDVLFDNHSTGSS